MKKLILDATYYYVKGFNITHINTSFNIERGDKWNVYKSPTNNISKLKHTRQDYNDLLEFDWQNSIGLGTVLGFNNLRALDFDECDNLEFIQTVLDILGLPENYEWLIRTGSGHGFHIVFYADNHNYCVENDKTKAFVPNNKNKDNFSVLELRWDKHLVLPPSKSNMDIEYKFFYCDLPLQKPHVVGLERVENLLRKVCAEPNGEANIGSREYFQYSIMEYLDFNPVKFPPSDFKPEPFNGNKISAISAAIRKGASVKLTYTDYFGETSERIISSLAYSTEFVESADFKQYIKGYCHLRNEERTFKISRIDRIEIIE
jgi:hypothetical protein